MESSWKTVAQSGAPKKQDDSVQKLKEIETWIGEKDDAQQYVVLIYGADGTGKTGLALSKLTPSGKTFLLDLDGGALPIAREHFKDKFEKNEIIVKNPLVFDGFEIDYSATIQRIIGSVQWVKQNYKKQNINCFVLDGVSTLLKYCEYIMRLELNKDMGEGIEMRFWQIRSKLFTEILTAIKSLPIDVVFIAHEDFIITDDKGSAVKQRLNQMAFQKIKCEKIASLETVKYLANIHKSKCKPTIEGTIVNFLTIKTGANSMKWSAPEVWEILKR